MNDNRWIIIDGKLRPAAQSLISAESRAAWYGDGCFETFRSYSGKYLELGAHIERLRAGLDYLQINQPSNLKGRGIRESLDELLKKNGLNDSDAIIRIQVWREGGRGFKIPPDASSHFSISALHLTEISCKIDLSITDTRRIPSESLNPEYKISNSVNYIRAAAEAARKNADDALMLTVNDLISETTIANIFWLKENMVYTPSEKCDILPGITRKIIIGLVEKELDTAVIEGEFLFPELEDAETMWVCNSVREIVEVKSIDRLTFLTNHPFLNELKSVFATHRNKVLS